MPNKGNRAQVWKYFHKENDNCVVCGICGQRLVYKSSTSTMRYHLERKHPVQWARGSDAMTLTIVDSSVESGDDNAGTSVTSAISSKRMLPPAAGFATNSPKSTGISYFITEFLIRDLLPMGEINKPGFKQLLKYLEPSYTLPDRGTILASLMRMYDDIRPSVQLAVKSSSYLSLTTEIWNSSTTQFYVTISAYWITDDWNLTSKVLATHAIAVGNNWDDIESVVTETLEDYSIPIKQLAAVVHPMQCNVSNETDYPVVSCFASTLCKAIYKGFEYEPVNRVVRAARKLVGNVRHLSGSIVELAMQQSEIKVSEIQLEQDVSSLWFTTFTMLERLRDQRSLICAIIGEDQMLKASDGLLGHNSDHWDLLNRIVEILNPLKTVTEVMCCSKNMSLSSVYPIIHGLITVHLSDRLEENNDINNFIQIIRSEISSIWGIDSSQSICDSVSILSSVLDPRYRNPSYLSTLQQSYLRDNILKHLNSSDVSELAICKQSSNSHSSSENIEDSFTPLEFLLGRHVLLDPAPNLPASDSVESELKLYMDPFMNPPASTDCDPLLWWQGNKQRFPHLAVLAQKYLGIPSTCAPTKHLFSENGLSFNCARARLEHDCIDYLLFLNNNISPSKISL